jgi:MFS family permease
MSVTVSGQTFVVLFLISLLLSVVFGYATIYMVTQHTMNIDSVEMVLMLLAVSVYFITPSLILSFIFYGIFKAIFRPSVPTKFRTFRRESVRSAKREVLSIAEYLPIAVAGAIMGILGVYFIEMNWHQKIIVYIFGGAVLVTGFMISEKIKSYREVTR